MKTVGLRNGNELVSSNCARQASNFLLGKCTKGCYAISVSGELPEDILDELRERGIMYQSRDNSDRT